MRLTLKGATMNVFILEDDPTNVRIPFFKLRLNRHKLYIAKDAYEGINLLQKMLDENVPIDYIFLDHDLGGRVFVNSNDENCGVRVAEFIKEKGIKSNIVLHTENVVGAYNMKAILPEATIIPFPNLASSMEG